MSSVSAAAVAPVVVSAAIEAKSASTDAEAQPFGNVLAQEMNKKSGDTQADTAQAPAETVAETPAEDATQAGQVQQAVASPWLLMMQQQAAVLVPPPVQAEVVETQDKVVDLLDQPVGSQALLLQPDVLQTGKPKDAVVEKAVTGISSGLTKPDVVAAQPLELRVAGLQQQAANVSVQAGKDLPQADLLARAASFTDELIGKLDNQGDTKTQQLAQPVFTQPQRMEQAQSIGRSEVAQHVVHEPVGDTRWSEAVAQRVSMMLGRQEQQMDMQLNPPHLGPMEVRLTLGTDQASVVFASQHAAVREALSAAAPRLTALLADQGIQLVNVQVASGSLHQHTQEQARQQAAFGGQGEGRREGARYGFESAAELRVLGNLSVPVARSGVSLYV